MSTSYDYTLTLTTVVHSDVPIEDDEARTLAGPHWSEAQVSVSVHVTGDDLLDQIERDLDLVDGLNTEKKAYVGAEQHHRLKRFVGHLERGYLPGEPERLTPEQITALRDRCKGLRRRIYIDCFNLPDDAVDRITAAS